jgi:hypothetical protein
MADKKVKFDYQLPASLEVPEGWKVAYECLDDILDKEFGYEYIYIFDIYR